MLPAPCVGSATRVKCCITHVYKRWGPLNHASGAQSAGQRLDFSRFRPVVLASQQAGRGGPAPTNASIPSTACMVIMPVCIPRVAGGSARRRSKPLWGACVPWGGHKHVKSAGHRGRVRYCAPTPPVRVALAKINLLRPVPPRSHAPVRLPPLSTHEPSKSTPPPRCNSAPALACPSLGGTRPASPMSRLASSAGALRACWARGRGCPGQRFSAPALPLPGRPAARLPKRCVGRATWRLRTRSIAFQGLCAPQRRVHGLGANACSHACLAPLRANTGGRLQG